MSRIDSKTNAQQQGTRATRDGADTRATYEQPRLTKKRSVARVTLFSGSGAAGVSGLTSA